MEHVDYAELVKLAAGAVTIILLGVAGWLKGRSEKSAAPAQVEVLAGSVVDSRVFRDATDAMRRVQQSVENFAEQQHADSRALRSVMEEMTSALKRNTEAQDQGAVTPREMMSLLGQINRSGE